MAEHGTVKWLTEDKGFGYIARDEGGMDVLFDYKSVGGRGFNALSQGDAVEFDTVEGTARATAVISSGDGPLSAAPKVAPEHHPTRADPAELRAEAERILRQYD